MKTVKQSMLMTDTVEGIQPPSWTSWVQKQNLKFQLIFI